MMLIIKRLKLTTLLGLLSGLGFVKTRHLHPDAASTYGSENLDRMSKGLAPQRYNADKVELSLWSWVTNPFLLGMERKTLFLVGRKITPLSILTESQNIDK